MIANMAAHMLFKESYFNTDEFKNLDVHGQASQIMEHLDLLPKLDGEQLYQLSTILIKAMCTCYLIDFVTDELSGTDTIFIGKKHTPSCPAVRCPVIEDMSVSQISRRQKRELLYDHKTLVILEERSSAVKKKAIPHFE